MIKKTMLLIGLSLTLSSVPVLASDIDLTGKTVEELIQIRDAVDDALYMAGGKIVINGGEYLVGRDIAAGTYVITTYSNDPKYSYGSTNYSIMRDSESYAKWVSVHDTYVDKYYDTPEGEEKPEQPDYSPYFVVYDKYVDKDERITLENGQVLKIDPYSDTDVTIEKSAGGLFMDDAGEPMIIEQ